MTEKRATPRHRVFKGGIISSARGGIACTVRNMSERGAALDVADDAYPLPPSFKLAIEADNFLRPCRVVWSAGRRVGVAFD